jgi:hypothetical protein
LEETHPVFHSLGFKIEQIGCCRALFHPLFGFKVTASLVLSNHPIDSLLSVFMKVFHDEKLEPSVKQTILE